ncbi:MAG: TonB-dependent receptor, partial [Candidatus Cloacimonetes bacterium]|nr:TonB-dependent receptor [Candidatus Cloacimonadota bacterium]
MALLCVSGIAQARIHGYVRDAESGEGLIGANVQLLGTRIGAATNLDGYFVIPGAPDGPSSLLASYSGYESREEECVVLPGRDLMVTLTLKPVSILLEELVVTAERSDQERMQQEVNIGQVRMDQQRLRLSPVLVQTDVMRAFQSMPGVLPSNDFSSELNIRGSGADESLIVLDGVEVYNPSHLGGLFSSFIPSTVKHADLVRSSYAAQQGGRLGGVLQISTRDGNNQRLSTDLSLGLLSSSLMLEGPLYRTKESSWMLAARRSYLDLASRVLTPDSPVPYWFTDFQGRGNVALSTWDRLSLTGYWG